MNIPEYSYLPWHRLIKISLGVLGIAPSEFWQMTPCEWAAAFEGWKEMHGISHEKTQMSSSELIELCARFPDVIEERIV